MDTTSSTKTTEAPKEPGFTFGGMVPDLNENSTPETSFSGVSLVDNTKPDVGLTSLVGNNAQNTPKLTNEELTRKVDRYSFALQKDFSRQQVEQFLSTGNEEQLRKYAAEAKNIRDEADKHTTLKEILAEGTPEDPKQQSVLYGNVKAIGGFKPNNNPDTVVEEEYAKHFIRSVPSVGPQDSAVNRMLGEVSDKAVYAARDNRIQNATDDSALSIEEAGVRAKIYQENAKDVLEKAEHKYAEESLVGKVVDFTKSAVPFNDYYNMTIDVPGMEAVGVFTGTAVSQWVTKLYDQPPAVQKQWLSTAVEKIGAYNPGLAVRVAEAAVNYSTTEKYLDNMFGVLDVVDAPQLGLATVGMAAGLAAASAKATKAALMRREGARVFREAVSGTAAPSAAAHASPVVENFDFDRYVKNIGAKTTEAMERAAREGRYPNQHMDTVLARIGDDVSKAMRAAEKAAGDDPERFNNILKAMGEKVSRAMKDATEKTLPYPESKTIAEIGKRTREVMPPQLGLEDTADIHEFFHGRKDTNYDEASLARLDALLAKRFGTSKERMDRLKKGGEGTRLFNDDGLAKDILWQPSKEARPNAEAEQRLMEKLQKRSGRDPDRKPMTSDELSKLVETTQKDLIQANAKLVSFIKREKKGEEGLSEQIAGIRKWVAQSKKGLQWLKEEHKYQKLAEARVNIPGARSAQAMQEGTDALKAEDRAAIVEEIKQALADAAHAEAQRMERKEAADALKAKAATRVGKIMKTAPGPSQLYWEAAEAYRSAIRAGADPRVNPADFQAAMGSVNGAAVHNVASTTGSQATPVATQNLASTASGFVNPTAAQGATNGLAAAQTGRFANYIQSRAGQLKSKIDSIIRINRLPEEALQEAFIGTQIEFEAAIGQSVNNAIQNARTLVSGASHGPVAPVQMGVSATPIRPEANPFNLAMVEFEITKPNGQTFSGQHWNREMDTWARIMGLRPGDYGARNRGNGWTMVVTRPVDETRPYVRNHLLSTTNLTPPDSIFAWLKHGGGRVSEFSSNNRIAYVTGQEKVRETIEPLAKDFLSLKPAHVKALDRVMTEEMNRINPSNNLPGHFFENASEFENAYRRLNGRSPTTKETNAYISARILNDLEYGMRSASYYKELARLGIKKFELSVKKVDPNTGTTTFSKAFFEGKVINRLPLDAKDDRARALVTVYDEGMSDPKIVPLNALMTEKGQGYIQELQDKGYKIIQTANPVRKPGKEVFGEDESVNFILTRDFVQRELNPDNLIGYREGWHQIYPYKHYIKQPVIRKIDKVDAATGKTFTHHIYEGEVTLMGVHSAAEARKYADAMEIARQIRFENRAGNLDQHLADSLPYTRREFERLFQPGPNGEPPKFSPSEPFHPLGDGQGAMDAFKPQMDLRYQNLYDAIRSPWNLMNQVDKKFVGHRDEVLHTVKEGTGTQGNPVFNLVRAEKLDPLSAMSDGIANMVRNHHMIDLRLQMGESWIKEFGNLLEGSPQTLYNDLVNTIMNPPWIKNVKNINSADYYRAENARKAFLELLNLETLGQARMESLRSSVINWGYEKYGQETSNEWATSNLMTTRHPLSWFRGIVYHAKVGFLNPMVAIQNCAQIANVMALSPKHAPGIIPFGTFAWLTRLNSHPNIVNAMGQLAETATRGAYKKEWFVEAIDAMKKSGYWSVGGGHALGDYLNDPKFVATKTGQVLNGTSVLFTESEKLLRTNAFMTAFIEHKVANPNREVTSIDLNSILGRANLYTGRMTRDEKARWQSGEILSTVTQFWSYQARLTEMLLEKAHGRKDALTGMEKFRLLAMNSALYGIPVGGLGSLLGAFVNPYDHIKQYMVENDYHWDEGKLDTLFSGLLGVASKHYLGVNVAPAIGPTGRDLTATLDQDLGWIRFVTGPSGSTLLNTIQSAHPLYLSAWMMVNGEPNIKAIPGDLLDIARNVSGVDKLTKMYLALVHHKAFTKTGQEIGDVDSWPGVVSAITGQPINEYDHDFTEREILRNLPQVLGQLGKQAAQDFRLSQQAHRDGDYKLEAYYAKRANYFLSGLSLEERQKVLHKAIQGDKALIEENRKQWEKHSPNVSEEFKKAYHELFTNVPAN